MWLFRLASLLSPQASAAAAALAAAVVADCPMLTEGMLVDGGGNADMLVLSLWWCRWMFYPAVASLCFVRLRKSNRQPWLVRTKGSTRKGRVDVLVCRKPVPRPEYVHEQATSC